MNLKKTGRDNDATRNPANRVTILLLIIYLMAICWILLLKLGVHFSYMEKRSVNLVPFDRRPIFLLENILNIIIFIPMGLYAAALFVSWGPGRKVFFFFLLSLIIESLQYILRIGAFDVTDIIMNTAGGVIGMMMFKAVEKGMNSHVRAQKCINMVAGAGTALMIIMLMLLKMNMLPVRYQ